MYKDNDAYVAKVKASFQRFLMSSVITQSVNVRSDPFGGYGKLPYQPTNGAPPNIRGTAYTHPGAGEGEPGLMGAIPVTQTARPGKQSNDTVQYARTMPQTGSIYNRMYDELTKDSVVFCNKDGIPNYAGNTHRLSVLRGIGWLNDEMRKLSMGIDKDDVANYMRFVFRTPQKPDKEFPENDEDAYTQENFTNNMAGRDASIGLETIFNMLTNTSNPKLRTTESDDNSPAKYANIAEFLRSWRMDGVVLAEDINDLKSDRLGTNHLLFNIVVGGLTNVRNVNISKHNTGTSGVPGGVQPINVASTIRGRTLPQEFDSEPLCGDDFYVALHLNPIQHGNENIKFHFEWRLWSTQRWNRIADRVMVRSGVLTTPPPLGGDEDGTGGALPAAFKNVITRGSMSADRLLEEQLFSTIVGGYKLGTVVDTHAAIMARQDALGGYGTPHQRCAAVRMSINIQWHGLLELRQRHGTNCAFANDDDKGRPVVLSSILSTQGLRCFPIDIGEAYSALGRVFDISHITVASKLLNKDYKDTWSSVRLQQRIYSMNQSVSRNKGNYLLQIAELYKTTEEVFQSLAFLKTIQVLQADVENLINQVDADNYNDAVHGKITRDLLSKAALDYIDDNVRLGQSWVNRVKPVLGVAETVKQIIAEQASRFRQNDSFYAFYNDVADCRDDADSMGRLQNTLVRAKSTMKANGLLSALQSVKNFKTMFSTFSTTYPHIFEKLTEAREQLVTSPGDVSDFVFQNWANIFEEWNANVKSFNLAPIQVPVSVSANAPQPVQASAVSAASSSTRLSSSSANPASNAQSIGGASQALDAALNAAARHRATASSSVAPIAAVPSNLATNLASAGSHSDAASAAAAFDELLQANPTNALTSTPTTVSTMPPPMMPPMPPPMPPPASRKKKATASDTLEDFVRSTMENMSAEPGFETVDANASNSSSGSTGSSRKNSRRETPQRQRGSGTSSSNADDDEFVDDDEGAGVFVPPPSRANKRLQRPQ